MLVNVAKSDLVIPVRKVIIVNKTYSFLNWLKYINENSLRFIHQTWYSTDFVNLCLILHSCFLEWRQERYRIRLRVETAAHFLFVLLRSFGPYWQVLKALAEKLSLLHQQLLTSWQELLKDVQKYNTDQQKKHREVLHCLFFVLFYNNSNILNRFQSSSHYFSYAFVISSQTKIW